jgi:hypothetical protein
MTGAGAAEPGRGDDPRVVQPQRTQVLRQIITVCTDSQLEPSELAAMGTEQRSAPPASPAVPRAVAGIRALARPLSGHSRRARRCFLRPVCTGGRWQFQALGARVMAAAVLDEL